MWILQEVLSLEKQESEFLMVVFIVRPWKKFMARIDTEQQTANKPLKFVTATRKAWPSLGLASLAF